MSINNFKLRGYQEDAKREILAAWASGYQNVGLVLPTGAGKTILFSNIIAEFKGASVAIAHRQELVSQISLALGAFEIRHGIIGPKEVISGIVTAHMHDLGKSFHAPNSGVAVAGVDTLIRRKKALGASTSRVGLWVQDETHHLLRENKWGKAVAMFPNAKGLGVTATPERADGKGLGRKADGVLDVLIVGPSMRELIDAGYLTDYRIFAPESDLDTSILNTGKDGDFTRPTLKLAVRKSHVIGDVVKHYGLFAPGMLGVTFASDVETAGDIAASFRGAGVPAEIVSAETPLPLRREILRKFRNREILQLVNVDLFGEGFDLPAIEVVSMARPTQSYALYVQQFGRALRILNGKRSAIIIDHVGNVLRHRLPDIQRLWSLDGRDRRASGVGDAVPLKVCSQCTRVYERFHKTCPYCGHYPEPAKRSGIEFVEGDLTELDPARLAEMRLEAARALMSPDEYRLELQRRRVPNEGLHAGMKRQAHLISVQNKLRERIALWAGYQQAQGRSDSESYRRFYHLLGVDVLGAQILPTNDTESVLQELDKAIENERITYLGATVGTSV